MLGSSVFLENSGGAGGSCAGADGAAMELRNEGEDGDKILGGHRWPQEETLALLKIRSEMDTAFRDSNVKAPLWDEVSRKLRELGYNRSAKKCKEKFENIHKYNKRIKEGKSDRRNSKHYKFFEQLQLLDNNFPAPSQATENAPVAPNPNQDRRDAAEFVSDDSISTSSSSGSESSSKKKRKMAVYFETVMRDVLQKQEELQNKFLEALEKCENDRLAREEAWRSQEISRLKREQEFVARERAIASAKDEAILGFLQKISQHIQIPLEMPDVVVNTVLNNNRNLDSPENITEKNVPNQDYVAGETSRHIEKIDNGVVENALQHAAGSSRWPKAEVEALIMLKTDYDSKYQDSGPKGPLWEEISSSMKNLGYVRSAKRCKEKWENINKYYKRVKESKKKRPVDAKTCPYFNLLDSIYSKRFKKSDADGGGNSNNPEQILAQMQEGSEDFNDDSYQQNQQVDSVVVEDEHDDRAGDGYRIVANDLSAMASLE